MKRLLQSVLVLTTAIAAVACAPAARHQAVVSPSAARSIALARVSGVVRAEELEHEDGRWVYSFEIKPTGETRKIIQEVNVDADTGDVVSVDTERE